MIWRTITRRIRQLWNSLRLRLGNDDTVSQARLRQSASEISTLVQIEDWKALRLHFSPFVRWFLPETLLRTAFNALRLTTGPIVYVGAPATSRGWLTTVVKVPIEFQHVKLAMVLQMTANGSLFGLKFWPQRLHGFGNPWQSPPYAADSTLWDETIVQLGPSNITVQGKLTAPRKSGRYPCIVMLPGSGPCDRDSSVEAAKPFKDLAIGLASLNIATLRFDKVTLTHGSRFLGRKDFTLTDEYMHHAESAVRYCHSHEKILGSGIFVLGHSLGGYVTPQLVEKMEKEFPLAGCILMAAPAGPLYWSALRQIRYIAASHPRHGEDDTASQQIEDFRHAAELADGPNLTLSTPASELPFGIPPAYWLDFRNYTPITTCQNLQKPIFIAQGGRDYQVTVTDDYEKWYRHLRDTPGTTFRLYENLNHLFIAGSGPSTPLEYDVPGNVDAEVVRDIGTWVAANIHCLE